MKPSKAHFMELYKSHLMILTGICVEIYARFRYNIAIESPRSQE